MGRDVTAFRKRFEDYKNGKSISEIYDAGLPRYESGKWSYIPSDKVRKHIAKWEGTDFAGQNELFGGDAIGAKAKEFTNTMKPIGANLTQDELDGLFATFYNVAPRTYEREFLPAVTNYANNKTWETQAAMDTALRNRYMLSKKIYQNGIKRRAAADVDLMGLSLQQPIQAEVPVSTAVRPVIKEEKTVPAYDPTISPYISGKPMVKLRPRVQLPNLIELMEDSEWEPGFPGLKNGKLPGYKIGHNVSNAKLNEDGTFNDDYTKVFEDMYVTPQKTDLKRGSYTLNNFPYYLQHRTDWMKPFMSSGTNEKGLEQPAIDPFLIALTGGRISGDLIGDAIGLGAEKAILHAATAAARSASKTKMGKRAVETVMRTSSNPTPFDKIKNGIKTFDKDRTKAVLNYIFTGKRNGNFGYYNSFAEDPSLAYTGFVSDKLKKTVDDLDEANIMLHNPESEYGDAIDAYLYNKQIDPIYGFDLKSIGHDFGPHDQYIAQNYKKVSKNIPVYQSPVQTLEIKIPDQQAYKVKPIETISDEGYIRGNYSNDGFVEYDSAGHLKQLGSFVDVPVSREQDIWKYLPSDYSKYATDLHGIKKLLQIIGTNAVDAAGTPIIVRTPWQYNPLYSREFIEKFPGYSNGKSPIYIKPANRGKFTALKKRTGHSASWFKENGTPEQKKMAVFALNAKKWKH